MVDHDEDEGRLREQLRNYRRLLAQFDDERLHEALRKLIEDLERRLQEQ